ncbi:MAG: GspMb/PilO family protein [Actinomycetota bacterium]|nr:GspMb/PilO family protein [Actinomycetota bacterium]
MTELRNRTLALLVGLVIAGVAWLVAVLVPTSRIADDDRAAIEAADGRAVALRQQRARLADIEPAPIEADLAVLEAAIPETARLPELIATIQRQADDAGVRLTALTPASAASVVTGPDDAAGAIAVATSTAGEYPAQLDYLANLERAERLIVVDAVSFLADPTDPSNLSLELTLRAFTDEDLTDATGDDVDADVPAGAEVATDEIGAG